MDVIKHHLVPKHSKLSDAEKDKLLKSYSIEPKVLPKILKEDPAIAKLHAKSGDVIRIDRESKTAGTTVFYRGVVDG